MGRVIGTCYDGASAFRAHSSLYRGGSGQPGDTDDVTTHPEPWPVAPDPLGEALHFLELRGAFYCRAEFTAPFGLELPPLEGYLWFHVITGGSCWLEAPEAQPRRLAASELADRKSVV